MLCLSWLFALRYALLRIFDTVKNAAKARYGEIVVCRPLNRVNKAFGLFNERDKLLLGKAFPKLLRLFVAGGQRVFRNKSVAENID